ncbi:MAG: (2Fe-2S)-binding protein [Ignavibacteriae bacterium HGW-Ignavibacteriae-3]|nr:MAG: (2Fe-2S)-binding protein [Ignavibacteriae bacterium HGW-Ignavibacteriae-3]
MIQFILNNEEVLTESSPTTVLLDFIRSEKQLTGTKEGCREGDCGACTILLGELVDGTVQYKSANSCLMPLSDAHGRHVVTVEALNQNELTPVQEAMVEEGGTQCGFCTPGFVVSMTGYFLNNKKFSVDDAVDAMSGNICRCTGYSGIERAAERAIVSYNRASSGKNHIERLIEANFIPPIFKSVKDQLKKIKRKSLKAKKAKYFVSGGTDLYVQQWENVVRADADFASDEKIPNEIISTKTKIKIGGATTIQQILESKIIKKYFPALPEDLELFGSLPIRNRATAAGNIVNASPIGDLTNIFIALDADLHLKKGSEKRSVRIRDFYKGYKLVDKKKDEFIEWITFNIPHGDFHFNFEKVSKRTYLDIASVNSSIYFLTQKNLIKSAGLSAGGVGPIPMYLKNTSELLRDKLISTETVRSAAEMALTEISPISDARGSAEYKKLLLRQLIYSHFLVLFPDKIDEIALLKGGEIF